MKATERVVGFQPSSEGYWTIPSKRGEIHLASTLLHSMTQDKSAAYATKEGFHAISMPEHFDLFDAIYELRDKGGEVEKARQFVRKAMRSSFPNTLTRLVYTPEGSDRIIHGYGTQSPIKKEADLVGPDGDVLEVLTPKTSLVLTGKNPDQVAELMQYINGTPTYVWRVNEAPSQNDERVAGFSANPVGANLYLSGYPRVADQSLGVKFSEARSAVQK